MPLKTSQLGLWPFHLVLEAEAAAAAAATAAAATAAAAAAALPPPQSGRQVSAQVYIHCSP